MASQTLYNLLTAIYYRPWNPAGTLGEIYPVAGESLALQKEKSIALPHTLISEGNISFTPSLITKREPTLNELDAAITAWNLNRTLAFTSGGTTVLYPGLRLLGHTGGATAYIHQEILTGVGTWAAGTAAGTFYLRGQTGAFQAENLDLIDAAGTVLALNVATIGGNSAGVGAITRANVREDFGIGVIPTQADSGYVYILPRAYGVDPFGAVVNWYVVGSFKVEYPHPAWGNY